MCHTNKFDTTHFFFTLMWEKKKTRKLIEHFIFYLLMCCELWQNWYNIFGNGLILISYHNLGSKDDRCINTYLMNTCLLSFHFIFLYFGERGWEDSLPLCYIVVRSTTHFLSFSNNINSVKEIFFFLKKKNYQVH